MQRNYSIDILKFICVTMVVFAHTKCAYQDIILPLIRCAVPCFFMISGYLLYKEGGIGRERIMRNFKHVAKITLWATILFIFWKEFRTIKHGGFVPSVRQMIGWVVLNDCPFGFHLWYLYAYLYVLLVVYIIDKHKQWKWLFISIPFLLMTDLAFGKYSLVVFGKEFPYILVRNFLCVGLPYFALGAMLKIVKTPYFNGSKIMLLGGGILFSLTSQLEKFILISIDKCPTREHYISSTFLAICLFLLLMSIKVEKPSVLSKIGERDTLYIYIFHPLFLWVMSTGFKKMGLLDVYSWIAPFAVLASTMAFIYALRKINVIK